MVQTKIQKAQSFRKAFVVLTLSLPLSNLACDYAIHPNLSLPNLPPPLTSITKLLVNSHGH